MGCRSYTSAERAHPEHADQNVEALQKREVPVEYMLVANEATA